MDEEQYNKFLNDVDALAMRHSVTRLKISTIHFDREFKRGQDGKLLLVSTKAVVTVLGHTTKVPIGEGCEFQTYEQAYEAAKRHWSEYYKNVRAKRSDAERRAEARRQKAYRERRRGVAKELSERQ